MQKINIITHFDLCTGCKLCQLACSERIFAGYNPHKSLLQIKHHSENLYHFPIVCNQCENAYCSRVCPVDAILRDSFTGAMVVDPDKCIACNLCNIYCPLHIIDIDMERNKAVKCDLCGGTPACVAACPTGALEIIRKDAQPVPKEEV